jgi:hypothetical protein
MQTATENEADNIAAMSPSDPGAPQTVRLFERKPEDRATSPASAPATNASGASGNRLPSLVVRHWLPVSSSSSEEYNLGSPDWNGPKLTNPVATAGFCWGR